MLIPNSHDLLVQLLVEVVPVCKRMNDALEVLWVAYRFNAAIGVSHQVVLKTEASWLLFGNSNLPDL